MPWVGDEVAIAGGEQQVNAAIEPHRAAGFRQRLDRALALKLGVPAPELADQPRAAKRRHGAPLTQLHATNTGNPDAVLRGIELQRAIAMRIRDLTPPAGP